MLPLPLVLFFSPPSLALPLSRFLPARFPVCVPLRFLKLCLTILSHLCTACIGLSVLSSSNTCFLFHSALQHSPPSIFSRILLWSKISSTAALSLCLLFSFLHHRSMFFFLIRHSLLMYVIFLFFSARLLVLSVLLASFDNR